MITDITLPETNSSRSALKIDMRKMDLARVKLSLQSRVVVLLDYKIVIFILRLRQIRRYMYAINSMNGKL